MSFPRACLAALVAAPLLAAPARAQRVAVQHRDSVALRVAPGGSGTAVFRVTNAGPGALVLQPSVDLPRGWTLVAPEPAATLAPGARALRLVGFAVPRDARAGSYWVALAVRAPGTPRDSVRVVVAGRRGLAVRVEEAPRFAVAGESYRARFVVQNRGNAPEAVSLRLASSHGMDARLEAERITLAAGESRALEVVVSTRRGPASIPHRLEVRARAAADSTVTAAAVSRVEIVARGGSGEARPRLPVEVRLRNSGGGTPVPALSGSGALSGGGASRVDFLFRPADAAGTLLGDASEYRLRYARRGLDVLLGDQLYSLSPLTQPGRFGFGAGGMVAAGPVSAGGFVMEDRRTTDRRPEWGAQARLGVGRIGSVGAHYLDRGDSGAVASARVRLTPAGPLSVDAEFGAGSGTARSVTIQGNTGRATLYARHLRADSAYPAYFAGESVDEATASLRPWRALQLTGSAGRRRDATPISPLAWAAARDHLTAAVAWGSRVAAEYRHERLGDGELASTVVLRGTLRGGPLWIAPRAEVGSWRDSLGASSPLHRIAVQGGVNLGGQSVSGWVEHSTRSPYTLREDGALRASLLATLHPLPSTLVQGSVQGSQREGEWNAGFGEVGVWQTLPRGHRVAARARWGVRDGELDDGGPRLLLDYIVPIGVPTPRGGGSGRVAGRVFDAATGRGVAGVPVRLGSQVVLTNRSGGWSFDGVAPGAYALELDRLAAGLDRVPLRPIPAEVRVDGGRTVRVEVALAPAARVHGSIRVLDFVEGAAPASGPPPTTESGGLRDAVVVLTSAGESQRRVTDATGRFDFADLRPGRWTLRVEGADLPAHHRMERDSTVLDVAGGGANEVVLRVLPRFRPVRMIAGGEVRAGEAPPREPWTSPVPARVATRPAPAPAPAPRTAPTPTATPRPTPAPTVAPSPAPAVTPAQRPAPAPTYAQAPAPRAVPRAPQRPATAPARRPVPAPRPPAAPQPRSSIGRSGFSDWPYTTYTVQPGDRGLIDLAWLAYRDGAMWPRLWLANRDVLGTPTRIVPGQVIVIPAPGPLTAEEKAAARPYQSRMR